VTFGFLCITMCIEWSCTLAPNGQCFTIVRTAG